MKKVLVFTIFILALFISCSENDKALNNEPIIYEEGNITITLIEINEGRCPTNFNCFWQGNAEVGMRITNNSETTDFILNTAGYINNQFSFPNSISIFDLNIELLSLQPCPEQESMELPLEDYTVSLSVIK